MAMLLAFSPFLAFFLLARLVNPGVGLLAGTVVSLALLVRDQIARRAVKLLEVGTILLFAALAAFHFATGAVWTIPAVRLWVDSGLLLIVLLSLMVRQPFTLQYAREQVESQVWNRPHFLRINYVLTAVWAAAFAIMVGADFLMMKVPSLPLKVGVGSTILAIVGAYKFTAWYPRHFNPPNELAINEKAR